MSSGRWLAQPAFRGIHAIPSFERNPPVVTGRSGCRRWALALCLALAAMMSAAGAWAAAETVIYRFAGPPDGMSPYAGVIKGPGGVLFGTTLRGGDGTACGAGGCGTVFELIPPPTAGGGWTEKVLYNFQGFGDDGPHDSPRDGAYPWYGSLVRDKSGALYGTTQSGGLDDAGTVFKLAPPARSGGAWTEEVLYSFKTAKNGDCPYGCRPMFGLILDASGTLLYGTASGGRLGYGVVFELMPPTAAGGAWTSKVLYNFKGDSDGTSLEGLTIDATGVLYGATNGGPKNQNCPLSEFDACGTIFSLTPPTKAGGAWTKTELYDFGGPPDDGAFPGGILIGGHGALYGTTFGGGTKGLGTVFKLTPPIVIGAAWRETVLHSFNETGGASPYGGSLLAVGGVFWGTTEEGGRHGKGTVFELIPPAEVGGARSEKVLYSFKGVPDAEYPLSGLVGAPGGPFYGTTVGGGAPGQSGEGYGTVYEIVP